MRIVYACHRVNFQENIISSNRPDVKKPPNSSRAALPFQAEANLMTPQEMSGKRKISNNVRTVNIRLSDPVQFSFFT